jgi:hypothetical protein
MTPQKPFMRRTTALADAFVTAFKRDKGVDLPAMLDAAHVRMPTKREPNWRVTRREKKGKRR